MLLDAIDSEERVWIAHSGEQVPNPDSRITLAEERDRPRMRKVQCDWRLRPGDRRSVHRGHGLLARAVGAAGAGRLKPTLDVKGVLS